MGELISIIIPAYNVGQYLGNCLSSVLQQSYSEIEIIVVDDGSTDNTLVVAEHYQSSFPQKIRVVHTENRGVTQARLEGIKVSRGQWIGFVDGDDEIEYDMYERLYINAKKYDSDISHCGYSIIIEGKRIRDFYNTGQLIKANTKDGLKDLLIGPIEPGLWNKLYCRELLYQLVQEDLMDISIKYNEDLLMNYYLFRNAKTTVYEDFCGYHYMARSSSATRGFFRIEKVLDPVKVWKIILDNVESELVEPVWQKYLMVCINAYVRLVENGENKKEELECRRLLLANKHKWHLLDYRGKLKIYFVLSSPQLFKRMYGVYKRHFQKKVYV